MATPNTSASIMAIDSDNNPDWPLVLDIILLMFVALEPDRKRPDLGRVAENMGPFFTMEKIRSVVNPCICCNLIPLSDTA